MNNLHRELAPISSEAWTDLEQEARRTFRRHVAARRIVDVPEPAIDGAFLLSTRGGDFELRIGQDVSIGYLAHDDTSIRLYLEETLTFLAYTGEAVVALTAIPPTVA